jgi:leucine dehydrogenase
MTTTGDFDREFDHELVDVFSDPRTGVTGVIAVHSTALGPAVGGLRLRAYASPAAAVTDALRLSHAMSLKNSAAGLELGGGKAVVLDDGGWNAQSRAQRMRAVGDAIERLRGSYITAEDVGTTPQDMDVIAGITRWVAGQSTSSGGSGDPSPATARTVFGAIQAAVRLRLGAANLSGVRVGVQGVGSVGEKLAMLLAEAGAELIVCDIDSNRVAGVADAVGAQVSALEDFVASDVDVLAPCALGEAITPQHVARLRCHVVAGAANNPLADTASAHALADRGILYVPDFLANCGGVISVGAQILGYDAGEVDRRIDCAIDRTAGLLEQAAATGRVPQEIAVERALRRIRGENDDAS